MAAAPPEAGEKKKEKRMRVVRLEADTIKIIEDAYNRPPCRFLPDEVINKIRDPEEREGTRELMATLAALIKKSREWDEGILAQYRAKGYAEIEESESEDEDEDEHEGGGGGGEATENETSAAGGAGEGRVGASKL
ncbi:hypothetical protein ACP4OV_002061 [Aristida adscensionis]